MSDVILKLPFTLPDNLENVDKPVLEKETELGTYSVFLGTSVPCYPNKNNILPSLFLRLYFTDKNNNRYVLNQEESV